MRFCCSPVELDRLKEDLGTYKWDFSLPENISLGNYNDIFGRFYDTVKEKFTSYCLKAPLKKSSIKKINTCSSLVNIWIPKVNKKEAEPLEGV